MMKPDLLILDEPTLGLAPLIMEQISKALERLRKTTDITVPLSEQNVTFALPHADRVYVLERARIVWDGKFGQVRDRGGGAISMGAAGGARPLPQLRSTAFAPVGIIRFFIELARSASSPFSPCGPLREKGAAAVDDV